MPLAEEDEEWQEAIEELRRLEEMPLKEILEEKCDSFIEWDEDTPNKDDNAHAHFQIDKTDRKDGYKDIDDAIDSIFEGHLISWYCGNCRQGWRITNRREKGDRYIVTLKKCDE